MSILVSLNPVTMIVQLTQWEKNYLQKALLGDDFETLMMI